MPVESFVLSLGRDPTTLIVSCLSYVFLVYAGQYIMKDRNPLNLSGLLVIHNSIGIDVP
jgi:hypothetical protein